MIQDQDFHFCPRGASRPRLWSRGLHHWIINKYYADIQTNVIIEKRVEFWLNFETVQPAFSLGC